MKRRFMITRPRWRELSLAALALALVVVVCGIAPAPAAGATPRGCETGTAVDTISAKVQTVEVPAVLPSYGQHVLDATAIGLLLPSGDVECPSLSFSEAVSSRAPPPRP